VAFQNCGKIARTFDLDMTKNRNRLHRFLPFTLGR
jgi:hypothetical protein